MNIIQSFSDPPIGFNIANNMNTSSKNLLCHVLFLSLMCKQCQPFITQENRLTPFFLVAKIQNSMDITITKPFNTLNISSTPTILLDGDVLFPFKVFLFFLIMLIYPSTKWFLHTFTTLLIHQIHILPWSILITCYCQKIEQLKSPLECIIHLHAWPIDLLLILPLVQEEDCTYTCPPTFYKHDSKSQHPKFDLITIYHHF